MLKVSSLHLIELANAYIGKVTALYRIKLAMATVSAVHIIAVVDSGRVLCDCLMAINLGIPCKHFFTLLRRSNGKVVFHLALYNRRYALFYLHSKLSLTRYL